MSKAVMVEPSRAAVNVKLVRGDDLTPFVVQLRYPSAAPIVASAFTALAQVRKDHDSTDVLATFDLTLTQGDTTEDLAIIVRLSDTVTRDLDFRAGYWDLQVTRPGDLVHTPIYGHVTLMKDTTRA